MGGMKSENMNVEKKMNEASRTVSEKPKAEMGVWRVQSGPVVDCCYGGVGLMPSGGPTKADGRELPTGYNVSVKLCDSEE